MIHQSAHSNFMDIPLMIPIKALSQAGDIDPYLALEIIGKVVTTFFDKHLKNKDVDVSLLDSTYEMLDLKIFEGDSVKSINN